MGTQIPNVAILFSSSLYPSVSVWQIVVTIDFS